nr:hypothetical protein [uncultured Anaeromusa sp.]
MDRYYQKSVEDTMHSLGVSGQGLTNAEITGRQRAAVCFWKSKVRSFVQNL